MTAPNRDHLFPSTSIGRVQGSRLSRSPSHESLTAHPLLSPGNSSPTNSSPEHTTNQASNPRYVPYTPRHRAPPTAAPTGTVTTLAATSSSPAPNHQGEATSKLQLMNLKAATQKAGLDAGSVGWAILEKLVSENVEQSADWIEIWSAITSGKATLILPLESYSSQDKITPDFVKNHVALCDASRQAAPMVTLSGLRGVLNDETFVLQSSINPSSKIFQDLLSPVARSSTLSSLPPLPITTYAFPTFTFPGYIPSLPLPPRPQPASKPALPPRPNQRVVSPPSRLSNPFASLFGGNKPATSTASNASNTSPPASIHSINEPDHVVCISAFTMDRRIVFKDVVKDITRGIKADLKSYLASTAGLPSWAVDRVNDFAGFLYPVVKGPKKSRKDPSGSPSPAYVINSFEETPEELSEIFQEFYDALEEDLRAGGTPFLGRRQEDTSTSSSTSLSQLDEKEKVEGDNKIREIVETAESALCQVFYDRLFLQPLADDGSHDEALSNRIAALNMLDLGLEHLDISVGETGPEIDAVVKACGDMLSQLETCRSPSAKSAIMVAAHKIIVDGLARLPPIHLKSEDEASASLKEKPKSSSISDKEKERQPAMIDTQSTTIVLPKEGTTLAESPAEISSPHDSIPSIVEPASEDEKEPPSDSTNSPVTPPSAAELLLTVEASSLKEPTPVSGDLLFPLLIYSVVKSNPPHLISNLLFTQRFRARSVGGGEENYCLINLMAVAEFLENVDMAALGLGDHDKVMSTADLTPIPITRSPILTDTFPQISDGGTLRGRVEQQVDAIAGSANKVLTGVVDSSFGMLRSLLPVGSQETPTPGGDSASWNAVRPGFGLLRRESGFSIANMIAGVGPASRSRAGSMIGGDEAGQQMITVSRPGSSRSRMSSGSKILKTEEDADESTSEGESSSGSGDSEEDEEEEDEEDNDEEDNDGLVPAKGDARSIRSFESMMSASKKEKKVARKSLSDRLMGLTPRKHTGNTMDASSRPTSPALKLAPPTRRFMECTAGDLRISEVSDLLEEYRRLVEGVRTIGGFDE